MSDTKVIVRKNEITCWNCFTTEDDNLSDDEKDNSRSITLPKVREEHREKLKVYSFLASELSKPKAVSLKQKVSKTCTVGKKLDEKVLEIIGDADNMSLRCDENYFPEQLLEQDVKDDENDNSRPITLPKVREEHREKFKVYSFLASELSKPKAVPLEQQESKTFTVGEKGDEKVSEVIRDAENMSFRCDENYFPKEPLKQDVKDEENDNSRSVPLPKEREEHREKYKVNSFLASELCKPKAVPLEQQERKTCAVGEKGDVKVSEIFRDAENMSLRCDENYSPKELMDRYVKDDENDSSQSITLPKEREEHREKLKVYSFLASELCKPKELPLVLQKSKTCTVGKKGDEKVSDVIRVADNMSLRCDENYFPEEPLEKDVKEIQENVTNTITDDKVALDVSKCKVSDIQNSESSTSEDVINNVICENTAQFTNTKKIEDENLASISNDKNIQKSGLKHELSNEKEGRESESTLTPTVSRSKELVTETSLKLQKVVTNENPTLEGLIMQSETTIEPEIKKVIKRQSSISSEEGTDTKFSDLSDNCAENTKDLNTAQKVNYDNLKTSTITKLPMLKQNINSRYSPLAKLKRSSSRSSTTVPHSCIDKIDESDSPTITTVCKKFTEMSLKEENPTIRRSNLSKMQSKPLSPLSKTKTDTKNTTLLNQNKTKGTSAQMSPINKSLKSSTVTSKTSPSITPPILRKKIQRDSVTSPKSPALKQHKVIPTIPILKRKSSGSSIDTKCDHSSESSKKIVDVNVSQAVPPKFPKSDIGTKLPVLKQTMNSKYSPLHKLKISQDKVVINKDDNGTNNTSGTELNQKKPEEKTPVKELSDKNYSNSNIQLVTSTPNDKKIENKSDVSANICESPIESSKDISLSNPSAGAEEHSAGEYCNIDKSDTKICDSEDKVEDKEIKIDVSSNKKFLKSQSISAEALGKILSPSRVRSSTLPLSPRSLSFEDEMYISEESSGHATLPRRSNSPLPHDRDPDRERFPLNRSGLQTRSESMASVYSGAGEGVRGGVPVRGEVQFSLVYNYRLGALEVGVKRCRDLAPIDLKKNRSDPYVKVYLLPDKSKTGKRKTKVKKNTLNPVFEETLSFQCSLESLSSRAVWLSAWHADLFGRNDFLGEVTLPLEGRVFDDPAPAWHALGERSERPEPAAGSRGDLVVGLKFEEEEAGGETGTLHVLVKEARRLVPSRAGALADVFCKSYLLPERGRLHKQKTPVCRRTLAPAWRAGLRYPGLRRSALAERALELTLWDRDRLASNEFLGAVRLSRGGGSLGGRRVPWMDSAGKEVALWETMLQRPNFWVEGSLPLRPRLDN